MTFDRRHFVARLAALAISLSMGGYAADVAAGDAAPAGGCAIVADAAFGQVFFREGQCDLRVTPASTFKIPIALMGYDAGILQDAHTPQWDYPPGAVVNSNCDKGTVDPTIWESCSVVWYSQQITTRLGMERFRAVVQAFDTATRTSQAPWQQRWATRALLARRCKLRPTNRSGSCAIPCRTLQVSAARTP